MQAAEVLCFLVRDAEGFSAPCADNLNPIRDLRFERGGGVRLLWRHIAMPALPDMGGRPKFFRDKDASHLKEADRMVFWGAQPDGSICFVEARCELGAGDAT
jgi:hypothetical protein